MPRFSSRNRLRHRVLKRLDALAPAIVEQLVRDVPFYGLLPAEIVEREIGPVIEFNLGLFHRYLDTGRLPDERSVELLVSAAVQRAEERMPVRDVLAAHYAAWHVLWDELPTLAEPGEVAELAAMGRQAMTYLEWVIGTVLDAYVTTVMVGGGRSTDARGRLLTRLLAAEDHAQDWDEAELTAWTDRTVVVLRHRARRTSDPAKAAVADRRRWREVRLALERLAGGDVLGHFSPTGVVLALPGVHGADRVGATLAGCLRGQWHVGVASSEDRAGTPSALEAATGCAEVAERLGHPVGAYDLRQLMLEVQVTRPGPARAALVDVLAGLTGHPDLLETLAAHVAEGGRRLDTAKRLHVHPNTLDYRLRRIRELTGVDPNDRDGAQLLRSATIVHRYTTGADRA